MDPAWIGVLSGFSIVCCMFCCTACYEKRTAWKKAIREKWYSKSHLHQPLIPVNQTNPLLVRSGSKQWKMHELVSSK